METVFFLGRRAGPTVFSPGPVPPTGSDQIDPAASYAVKSRERVVCVVALKKWTVSTRFWWWVQTQLRVVSPNCDNFAPEMT
jgi:hypothetical protein